MYLFTNKQYVKNKLYKNTNQVLKKKEIHPLCYGTYICSHIIISRVFHILVSVLDV